MIVKNERDVAAYAVVEEYDKNIEQYFSVVSIDSVVGSSTFENVWFVDNSASGHMTRFYEYFHMITMLGS